MKLKYDKPQKVKTTEAELEVLAILKETLGWVILKRLAERYIVNLQKSSFKLIESDPNFKLRHAEMTGQALGITQLIRMVENSGKKLEEMEK